MYIWFTSKSLLLLRWNEGALSSLGGPAPSARHEFEDTVKTATGVAKYVLAPLNGAQPICMSSFSGRGLPALLGCTSARRVESLDAPVGINRGQSSQSLDSRTGPR